MSETHAVIISIVGTSESGNAFSDELRVLMSEIHALLPRAMPSFVLAAQPASVTTHELLSPPEHRRRSPLIATAEHEIITAARMWRDGRVEGAADRLRAAIEAWEKFPE